MPASSRWSRERPRHRHRRRRWSARSSRARRAGRVRADVGRHGPRRARRRPGARAVQPRPERPGRARCAACTGRPGPTTRRRSCAACAARSSTSPPTSGRGSPTFGRWFGLRLHADGNEMLIVPPGCAHGYITLEDRSDVAYWISAPYRPGRGPRHPLRRPAAGDRLAAATRASSPPATATCRCCHEARAGHRRQRLRRPPGRAAPARRRPRGVGADARRGRPARPRHAGRAGADAADADVLVHLAWEAAPGLRDVAREPGLAAGQPGAGDAPSPRPAAAASSRPGRAPSSIWSGRRRTPTASGRCTSACAPWPPPAASSWPGRGCSSCTAPASIPSAWSPRSRRASPPAARRSRAPAASAATTSTSATPGAAIAALATSSATGLFDVASGDAPGGGRHRPRARDRGRPHRAAAPRRAARRPTSRR